MAEARFILLADAFYQAMADLPRETAERFGKRLLQIGRKFEGTFVTRQLRGRPGLMRRTGNLARSIFVQVDGLGYHQVRLQVGFQGEAARYGYAHEVGMTIRPQAKSWLAFPLKGGPADAASGGLRPSAFGDLFFRKSRKDPEGTAMLVRNPSGGRMETVFILKKQVTMPERLKFFETFEHEQGDMLLDMRDEAKQLADQFNSQ